MSESRENAGEQNTERLPIAERIIHFVDFPETVLLKILQHVDTETIKNLLQTCATTRNLTAKFHPDMPKIPMNTLIASHTNTNNFQRRNNNSSLAPSALTVSDTDFKTFIYKYAPNHLSFNKNRNFLTLSPNWFKKIPKITVNLSSDCLHEYINIIKYCANLSIHYSFGCYATDIFNTMISVEEFEFAGREIIIDDGTLGALRRAVQRGNGLRSLKINTLGKKQWVSLEVYVQFIKNLKFAELTGIAITVGHFYIHATKEAIRDALFDIGIEVSHHSQGWCFHRDPLHFKTVYLYFNSLSDER